MNTDLNLLEKTEIWITNASLLGADLGDVAAAAARVLGFDRTEVLVVDVRDDHLVLDVLRRTIRAEDIVAKERALLDALESIEGVMLSAESSVHAEGVLGLISLDPAQARELLDRAGRMVSEIRDRVKRRALVFASGFEVKGGMIRDTNTPYILETLQHHGFSASAGGVLDDDERSIALRIREAAESGYGLIITTGGAGAEDKDRTIEGITLLDRQAATPWVVKYRVGTGRHVKDGVRVAVGEYGSTIIVAFPGPTDEVRECLGELLACLGDGELDQPGRKARVAERIATRLAAAIKRRAGHLHPHERGNNHGGG
ncbi:MAG: competence/damage-inducible protein A [Firmicutes bacterium]|nr:competence/damage-inducible protein A [Bacillota bacterium]